MFTFQVIHLCFHCHKLHQQPFKYCINIYLVFHNLPFVKNSYWTWSHPTTFLLPTIPSMSTFPLNLFLVFISMPLTLTRTLCVTIGLVLSNGLATDTQLKTVVFPLPKYIKSWWLSSEGRAPEKSYTFYNWLVTKYIFYRPSINNLNYVFIVAMLISCVEYANS